MHMQWEYALGPEQMAAGSILPDGSGGVIFKTVQTNTIIWLDQNGAEIYKRTGAGQIDVLAANAGGITFYIDDAVGYSQIIHVDPQGRETPVQPAVPGYDFLPIQVQQPFVSDQLGFFIYRTNSADYFLMRYAF